MHRKISWASAFNQQALNVLVLCCIGVAGMNSAAQAQKVRIGVLDQDKISQSYHSFQEALDTFNRLKKHYDEVLKVRVFLSGAQGARLDQLALKVPRTDAELTETADLLKKGLALYREYVELQYVDRSNKITPAERSRFDELKRISESNMDGHTKLHIQISAFLKKEEEDTIKRYEEYVNFIIQQIAEEKGLSAVVDNDIWTAPTIEITDITSEVITRLNKPK